MAVLIIICAIMVIAGIVMTAFHFKTKGHERERLFKIGVRSEAVVDSVTKTPDGLITPVIVFTAKWGMEYQNISFSCDKEGFKEEDYPEMLKPGKTVKIIYNPQYFDCVLIDMGDGTYFGQCKNSGALLGYGISLIIGAPIVYIMLARYFM